MVSYASMVVSFLLLAGPVLVINAVAPEKLDQWSSISILSAGLFISWMAIQLHEAFTKYRVRLLLENTKNMAFIHENLGPTPKADTEKVLVVRKPDEITDGRPVTAPVTAAVAQRAPIT